MIFFKKIFLIAAHQNNLKTLKKLILNNFYFYFLKYRLNRISKVTLAYEIS